MPTTPHDDALDLLGLRELAEVPQLALEISHATGMSDSAIRDGMVRCLAMNWARVERKYARPTLTLSGRVGLAR